jgi:hypothetical protein
MWLCSDDNLYNVLEETEACMVGIPTGARDFPLVRNKQTASSVHPSFYTIDIGGSFSGIRRPGYEVDHGAPFTVRVKVKNEWSYKFTPIYAFVLWPGTCLP